MLVNVTTIIFVIKRINSNSYSYFLIINAFVG